MPVEFHSQRVGDVSLLAIWGSCDQHFLPAGALAYQRDLPQAEIVLLEAGHSVPETHAAEIGAAMWHFLGAHDAGQQQ